MTSLGMISCEQSSARHILEGRFEVKSNIDSGVVSIREVLDGF